MMRLFVVLLASTAMLPSAAAAAPARHALVIGNAEYRNLTPLYNTVNDATDMAAALGKLGFTVARASNTNLETFEKGLAAFAADLKPGDTAIVYFAGHGVTGRTAADAAQTDSFLLPVDVALTSPNDVPQRARGLAAILAALDTAQAGVRLVILDACRNNPFASVWPADEPGAAGGLVQPAITGLRSALVVFATSPGEYAIENEGGRNGLFTQELLKRLDSPGVPLSVMLADVSAAVEFASKGEQIPFFVAGDPEAATFILRPPLDRSAGAPTDPLMLDLRLQRQADECGLAMCLEVGALEVRDAALRDGLVLNAKNLRNAGNALGEGVIPATVTLPPIGNLAAPVAAIVANERKTINGALRIGRRFLLGLDDFPRDTAVAFEWYKAAGEAGSGAGAYEVASAYHNGLSGIARNRVEAYRWLIKAAKADYPAAYSLGGRYRLMGWGGQIKNQPAAMRWFEEGEKRGDPASALELGKQTDDQPTRQDKLFQAAAAKGLPEALFRLAVLKDPASPETLRLLKRAGELGYWGAYTRLGVTAANSTAAISWFTLAATRGDGEAMYRLAKVYDETGDCAAASLWLRRAAVIGDAGAVAMRDGPACAIAATKVGR